MQYNPLLPLCFTSNWCGLQEYISYETTYETQTIPDTLRNDAKALVSGTHTQTEQPATSEQIQTERAVAGGVSEVHGAGAATERTANRTGTNQLTLF